MEIRTAYVIYNTKTRQYATRKNFTEDFADCRIYKERHHAENCIRLKHANKIEDLAIIPIEVKIDPYDQFSALIGAHSI